MSGIWTSFPPPSSTRPGGLLRAWSAASLVIAPAHPWALASIGAIGSGRYGNAAGYFHIPCAVEWESGERSDPSIVLVTNRPPTWPGGALRLFARIAKIGPSCFAQPFDVRCATRAAEEQRMRFAPTAVEDQNGRILLLNWATDVVDFDGAVGENIRLTKRPWIFSELPPIVSEPDDRTVKIYADPRPYSAELTPRCPGTPGSTR